MSRCELAFILMAYLSRLRTRDYNSLQGTRWDVVRFLSATMQSERGVNVTTDLLAVPAPRLELKRLSLLLCHRRWLFLWYAWVENSDERGKQEGF